MKLSYLPYERKQETRKLKTTIFVLVVIIAIETAFILSTYLSLVPELQKQNDELIEYTKESFEREEQLGKMISELLLKLKLQEEGNSGRGHKENTFKKFIILDSYNYSDNDCIVRSWNNL